MPIEIIIEDTLPNKMISAIAKKLEIEEVVNNNEVSITLPKKYGNGSIKHITFSHGISILEANVILKDDIQLNYVEGKIHPLKIVLVKNGTIKHTFNEQEEKTNYLNSYEYAIIASNRKNNNNFILPKDTEISFFSIQINRKKFEPKIQDFILDMHVDISQLLGDLNGVRKFYYKNFFNINTSKLLDDFIKCEYVNFMKSTHLEGITYELLVNQFQNYLVNLENLNSENSIALATRRKIKEAVSYIENDIEHYENIEQLSKKVSLNKKTLQNGFKVLFNTTVNKYVSNYRVFKAKELLKNSDLTISEITYKLGFNSPSYLTKVFKSYYGVTPLEYKKKLLR